MPLYEYVCADCGQPFEKMMRFSELNQQPNCPTCSSTNTKKQISLFASSGSSSASMLTGGSASCGTGGGRFR
ncbi:MAG: hypothetical protein BGO78_10565 [Chloroflexi bacterium 44-23]|nr:MAG: hypothetical protein BGO78_10565 [Chloroflexi bacterium 44-23]